jgi:hypothetical protein
MRNNIATAASYYTEALNIYQKENDKAALSVMLNIATLYNLQKNTIVLQPCLKTFMPQQKATMIMQ